MDNSTLRIVVSGTGIGGLTTTALFAKDGYRVTVLEAQTYPGGCAGTFFHQGYRFDAGATIVGGFQPNGPHARIGQLLDIKWPVRRYDPAWIVHLPDRAMNIAADRTDLLHNFPESQNFWREQAKIADLGWSLAAQNLPWPPGNVGEMRDLARIGIANFPTDLLALKTAFISTQTWLRQHKLIEDKAFIRFIDAQLLISAQTTSANASAFYSASALDLARQEVYEVERGVGGLAEALVDKIRSLGGEILYRHHVTRVKMEQGQAIGVFVRVGRHSKQEIYIPCDFLVANLTPQSVGELLAPDNSPNMRLETQNYQRGWGAFVLHVGVEANNISANLAHHQIITDMDGSLGEGCRLFVSFSPTWDSSRAPEGHRAVTITTHTQVEPWWHIFDHSIEDYELRKAEYTSRILQAIDVVIPGFMNSTRLVLAGTPITYNFYTKRHSGMVGGFPQTSLLKVRGPHTGIPNIRLVGDSIFPGQSTAGVTLGAIRVAKDVLRVLPLLRSRRTD